MGVQNYAPYNYAEKFHSVSRQPGMIVRTYYARTLQAIQSANRARLHASGSWKYGGRHPGRPGARLLTHVARSEAWLVSFVHKLG